MSHHSPAIFNISFCISLLSRCGSPGVLSACPLQAVGVADEFVQHVDNLPKLRPVTSLLLPAVQHQLVERNGAVHWRGQPIAFLNRFNHLSKKTKWYVKLPDKLLLEIHLPDSQIPCTAKLSASLRIETAPIHLQKPELDLSIAGNRSGKLAVATRCSQMADEADLKL